MSSYKPIPIWRALVIPSESQNNTKGCEPRKEICKEEGRMTGQKGDKRVRDERKEVVLQYMQGIVKGQT